MITKKLPVGVSDFKDMVTGDYYYVDKTLLIKEIMDKGDKILLIPRPRRFGKTLNLFMLKYFYDCCPEYGAKAAGSGPANSYGKLFDSLAITGTGKKYLDHMGKYPVKIPGPHGQIPGYFFDLQKHQRIGLGNLLQENTKAYQERVFQALLPPGQQKTAALRKGLFSNAYGAKR
jgi:hypothetical protein